MTFAAPNLIGGLPVTRCAITVRARQLHFEVLADLDAAYMTLLAACPDRAAQRPKTLSRRPLSRTSALCPHFGVVWPAAIALSEFLLNQLDRGRDAVIGPSLLKAPKSATVLELGCGLALPSLVVAQHTGCQVLATDRHHLAGEFIQCNAALNSVTSISYRTLDWRRDLHIHAPFIGSGRDGRGPEAAWSLIMGSDLLYEPWQPGYLASYIRHHLAPSGVAIIADPGRRFLTDFLALAAAHGLQTRLHAQPIANMGGQRITTSIVVLRLA